MKIIIVDDEPKALDLLRGYAARFTDLDVVATFRNGLKALEFLNKNFVDLALLDINMPHLNGMSLSRLLPPGVKVIFTTAYSEYAVESYEVNAADYLLKPITFERFAQAISKLLTAERSVSADTNNLLLLKSGTRIHRLAADDIDYLEKEGNYLAYHAAGETILTRQTFAEALATLPDSFVQVHRSFIVPLSKIEYLDTAELKAGGRKISVGAQFREALVKRFGKKGG